MDHVRHKKDSSANVGQGTSGVVQEVGISAADGQIASVLIISDRAILHEIEGPHWFVVWISKPGADIGEIWFSIPGHAHGGLLTSCVSHYGTINSRGLHATS